MKILNSILLVSIVIFIFQSCTVEKRRYNSGYHVEWSRYSGKMDKRMDSPDAEETSDSDLSSGLQVLIEVDSSNTDNTIAVNDRKEPEATEVRSHIRREKKDVGDGLRSILPEKRIFDMPVFNAGVHAPSDQSEVSEEKMEVDQFLSIIAFVFALISIACLIAARAISGWAALGYLVYALFAGILCALFALIAYGSAKKRGNALKWYLIFSMIYGFIWAFIVVLILFSR